MNFQSLQETSRFCDVCRMGELGEGTTWGLEKVGTPGHCGALELRSEARPYCSPADHYFPFCGLEIRSTRSLAWSQMGQPGRLWLPLYGGPFK